MGLVKTLFTQAFPPALKDYYDSELAGKANAFIATNTATSSSETTTYNQPSGVITFSVTLMQSTSTVFTVNNTFFSGKYPKFNIYNVNLTGGAFTDIYFDPLQTALGSTALSFIIDNTSAGDIDISFEFYFTT
jgi:hypothetical protein